MYDANKVIEQYDRAIHKAAHKYYIDNTRFSYDDLVAQGQLAAVKASKMYDEDRSDAKFFTYLTNAVENEVKKFVGDNVFDISVSEWERTKEYKKNGNLDKIKEATSALRLNTHAPDSDIGESGYKSLDFIIASGAPGPEESLIKKEALSIMKEELDSLAPHEKMVIEERWIEGKTLRELSKKMNVTFQTVSVWEKNAFDKLQKKMQLRFGKDF